MTLLRTAALLCLCAGTAQAQTRYYFSPSGSDAAACILAAPCASLAKANTLDLDPGDMLLFEGGETFRGNLVLTEEDAGTSGAPILIGSYGAGRATLDAGAGTGIDIHNAGGYVVRDLIVVGDGHDANTGSGIWFFNDLPGDAVLAYVRVHRVDVSGFGYLGLSVGGWNGRAGWTDIAVTNSRFHGNVNGAFTFGEEKGAISDVRFAYNAFFDNPGDPGSSNPSGSGLVIGQTDGALVERNLAYGNGSRHRSDTGPYGIWAYESNDVVIQYNESFGNATAGPRDGGGFDLDGGVTNSVLQYNYSHDNEGPGILLYQYRGASAWNGNVVRYNISRNDRGGGLQVGRAHPGMSRAEVYNNVFWADGAAGAAGAFVALTAVPDVRLTNNIFVATGGVPLVRTGSGAVGGYAFVDNAYWTGGDAFAIRWGGTSYPSLAAWRAATGQETLNGLPVGTDANPRFLTPRPGSLPVDLMIGDPDQLASLPGYQLARESPLIGAGQPVPGVRDYYGNAIPCATFSYSVGVHEPCYGIEEDAPRRDWLAEAYPNPAVDTVTIRFVLPEAGAVRLAVYDVLGREVAVLVDGERDAGRHSAQLDVADLVPGRYFWRLAAAGVHGAGSVTVSR